MSVKCMIVAALLTAVVEYEAAPASRTTRQAPGNFEQVLKLRFPQKKNEQFLTIAGEKYNTSQSMNITFLDKEDKPCTVNNVTFESSSTEGKDSEFEVEFVLRAGIVQTSTSHFNTNPSQNDLECNIEDIECIIIYVSSDYLRMKNVTFHVGKR